MEVTEIDVVVVAVGVLVVDMAEVEEAAAVVVAPVVTGVYVPIVA